jgi:L-fuconolactonase
MIDAHVHFWDPARMRYDWLKYVPEIAHAHLPEHFAHTGSVIFVQSDCLPEQALREVDWAGQFAITGIVAYAPLERGFEVGAHLTELLRRPLVKGVRRNAQNEAAGFMLGSYTDGMIAAADAGLTIDMCIRAHQMAELATVLTAVPEATVILDHLGKPDIAHDDFETWAPELSRLAQFPNLFCKRSKCCPIWRMPLMSSGRSGVCSVATGRWSTWPAVTGRGCRSWRRQSLD